MNLYSVLNGTGDLSMLNAIGRTTRLLAVPKAHRVSLARLTSTQGHYAKVPKMGTDSVDP